MTPKEKAKELVSKMYKQIFEIDYGADISEDLKRFQSAKQCALIAVDEIIEAIKEFHTGAEWQLMETMAWTYWHKVKEEMDLL